MKKLSEVYKELEVDFRFPIKIEDSKGNVTYHETIKGYWYKSEYDANGNETYHQNGDGYWEKYEYDSKDNETYFENSRKFWYKYERDSNGKETYFEDSYGIKQGTPKSAKTCEGKVVEVDGIKYELKTIR